MQTPLLSLVLLMDNTSNFMSLPCLFCGVKNGLEASSMTNIIKQEHFSQ